MSDAGAAGVLLQNNLVYRTTDASLHVNAWNTPPPSPVQPNTFKNNILAYGAMGVMDRHNDTNFLNVVYENNIFYYDKNTGDANSVQYGYWYCEGKTVCTSYFQFNDNIYFDKAVSGGQPAQPFFKTPHVPDEWRTAATNHAAHLPAMAEPGRGYGVAVYRSAVCEPDSGH